MAGTNVAPADWASIKHARRAPTNPGSQGEGWALVSCANPRPGAPAGRAYLAPPPANVALFLPSAPPLPQEEAITNVAPADWASEQRSGLRRRYQRLRHLAFLCTALALKYAEDEEERVELLQITADR